MPHLHDVIDSEQTFTIDVKTRAIEKALANESVVQFDHNSERVTFVCPRYIDGHDITLCDKAEIHYINTASSRTESSKGVYLIDDLAVDDWSTDNIKFTWLISGNATKYAGTLAFLVRFVCLDGTAIVYDWHTEIFESIAVRKGMNNGEAVAERNSDVLEAWKREILDEIATGVYCGKHYTIPVPSATDADISPWVEDDNGYVCVKPNKDYTDQNFILHQCSDNTVYVNNELKVTVGAENTTVHVSSLPEIACTLHLLVFNAYNGGEL